MREDVAIATWTSERDGRPDSIHIRKCRLEVVTGPGVGTIVEFAQPAIVIGRTGGDLRLDDQGVSSLHCEIRLTPDGYRLRDLGSTNGTHVRGVRIVEGYIAPHATIGIGESAVVFDPLPDAIELPLFGAARLGPLVGRSTATRHLFGLIERVAASDVSVLIEGEPGTGKRKVAEAIHVCSERAGGAFKVLDCGTIPAHLFEDQLFGREVGDEVTTGVVQAANRGTLFLDEIGELPLEIQARLLRVIESRRVRRIGGTRDTTCDVRIIVSTNRDLPTEVNRNAFRPDLYYRIAVVRLTVPPLRERRDDIPLLVDHFVRELAPDGTRTVGASFLAHAAHHGWPGNVGELRSAVERNLISRPGVGREA